MTDDTNLSEIDRKLLEALTRLPPVARPPDLAERFRDRVPAELLVERRPHLWVVAALAAMLALVLGGGWWVERSRHQAEVSELRLELTNALNDVSAPKRFEAINVAGNSALRDQSVVDALIHALLTDPNTNVRVAAAEALGRVADNRSLADAAERSFGREQSPFVQTELLRSVDRLDATDRRRVVSTLLTRRDIDSSVRREAVQLSDL